MLDKTKEPDKTQLALVPVETTDDDPDNFDWSLKNPSVILHQQDAVAAYFNPRDDLVIRRQQGWNETEDAVVVITRENIGEFLDKITDLGGVPSAGKS